MMKLLRDAAGTEFGERREPYKSNYAPVLTSAKRYGTMDAMAGLRNVHS